MTTGSKWSPSRTPRRSRKQAQAASGLKSYQTDVAAVINQSVKVTINGRKTNVNSYEAILRSMLKRALGGHVPSMIEFVKLCDEHGILAQPAQAKGGVLIIPKEVDYEAGWWDLWEGGFIGHNRRKVEDDDA